MPGTFVRAAREADVLEVADLVRAAYAPYLARMSRPPAPLSADYVTLVSAGACRVAVRDDRLVGLLVTWPHPDHLLVENLAVRPDVQGTGIGTALLRTAETEAHRLGLPRIRLYTNAVMTEAIAFYPRHGFVETRRASEHGYDRVFFERDLTSSERDPR